MNVLINGEMILSGTVGDGFFEDGFTYVDVIMALAVMQDRDIVVRLNSGGGIATEGVAIYNALAQHNGKITLYVDGIAASAASIIAMAGDEIVMRKGAMMMIHDPWNIMVGNADDALKSAEALNALGDSMAAIYAARTKRPASEIRTEMREEIWLTAEKAISKGYATQSKDSDAEEFMAFDYRAYAKAPERILALSDAKAWSNKLTERTTMPDPIKPTEIEAAVAAGIKAETERTAAITAMCATEGVPAMAATFIRDGVTVEAAQERIKAEAGRVKAIKEKVAQARKMQPMIEAALADQFIAAGTSLESVADELLNRMAAISSVNPQLGTHQATEPGDQAAITAMMDKSVDKINARLGFK